MMIDSLLSGYYMFIETSSPRRKGDNAILLSQPQTGTKCLSFWFHMFGPHIDRLTISTMSGKSFNQRGSPNLWQMTGTKGNRWIQSNVTLNENKTLTSYKVKVFNCASNLKFSEA